MNDIVAAAAVAPVVYVCSARFLTLYFHLFLPLRICMNLTIIGRVNQHDYVYAAD